MANDKKIIMIAGYELTYEQLFMMIIMAMVAMAIIIAALSAIISLTQYSGLFNNRSVLHLMMLGYVVPFSIMALPSLCLLLFGCFKECMLGLMVGFMSSIIFGTIFSFTNIIFDSYGMIDSLPLIDKFGISSLAFLALSLLVGLCYLGFYLSRNKQYEKISDIEMDVIKKEMDQACSDSQVDDLSLDLFLNGVESEESEHEEDCADVNTPLREVKIDVHHEGARSVKASVIKTVHDDSQNDNVSLSEESENEEERNTTKILKKVRIDTHGYQHKSMESA